MAAVLGLLAGELALNGCARHPLRVSWELAEPPKRLTIDSTVSYDPYFEAAPRNALAKELFELFHHGRVDLAAAPRATGLTTTAVSPLTSVPGSRLRASRN